MSEHIAAALLGSRRRAVLAVVVVLVGLLGGLVATGVLGAPAVESVENRFGAVDEETTTIETNITVSNPNPFGVTLDGVTVNYGVRMNDVHVADGQRSGIALESGTTTVGATTEMRNERIVPWWRSHLRNGERTVVTVDADVRSATLGRTVDAPNVTREVETDMLSQFNSSERRPVNADSAVVSDPVLYVEQTNATWGTVNESVTPLHLSFVVTNPKPYPVGVTRLGYDIAMNDVDVGNGTTESGYVVPPGATRTVEATTYVRNERLDEWWVSHLERDQETDLRIEFDARLDAGGQTVSVPLDPLTYEETIETDVFGTKPTGANESATGNDSAAESGSTEGEPTETESTAVETTDGETETTDGDGGVVDGALGTETATSTPASTDATTETEADEATTEGDDGLLGVADRFDGADADRFGGAVGDRAR